MKTLPNIPSHLVIGPQFDLFLGEHFHQGMIRTRLFLICNKGTTLCQFASFANPEAPLASIKCRPDHIGHLFYCN